MAQPPGRFNPARFSGRSLTGGAAQTISGTGPVLAEIEDGDALSGAVTWGSYSSPVGSVTTTKEMRVDSGSWIAYSGGVIVEAGETWQVREIADDTFAQRTFVSAARTAPDLPEAWDVEGGDGGVIIYGAPAAEGFRATGGDGFIDLGEL